MNRTHITLMDQALVSGVNFTTNLLLARFLGLEHYGRFSLAWMTLLLLNTFQASLIFMPMLSIGPKQADTDAPAYFGAVFTQQGLFALGSLVLILVGGLGCHLFFPSWDVLPILLPLAVVTMTFQLQDFLRRYFFTVSRPMAAFCNDLISYGGQLAVLALLLWSQPLNSEGALWAIAATSGLAFVTGMFFLNPLRWDKAMVAHVTGQHWQFGSWLTLSNLVQWAGSQGIIAIAGAMLGASSVGGIRAVINITAPVNIIMQGLRNVLPVEASRMWKSDGEKGLVRYLVKAGLWVVLGLGAVSILMVLFQVPMMTLLYGTEYVDFAIYVKWQAVYVVLGAVVLPLTMYFRTLERTHVLAIAFAVAMALSVITTAVLIKPLQMTAVFIGLVVNQGIMGVVTFGYFGWDRFKANPSQTGEPL